MTFLEALGWAMIGVLLVVLVTRAWDDNHDHR